MTVACEFAPYNGLNAHLSGRLDKKDQSVQSIRVGEAERLHPMSLGRPAKVIDRAHSPALGVMGMNIEMDKICHEKAHLLYSHSGLDGIPGDFTASGGLGHQGRIPGAFPRRDMPRACTKQVVRQPCSREAD